MTFLYVADAVGISNGNIKNDVLTYLNSIDITQTPINGLTYNQNENNTEISLNINTKFDTSSLKTIYFEIQDLQEYETFLKNDGSIQKTKGYLLLNKRNDKNNSTIIIGEKSQQTDLTYKSILSIIELLYPNELEEFKKNFPKLENKTFTKYQITLNPTLKEDFKTYGNDYKFTEIKINKTI